MSDEAPDWWYVVVDRVCWSLFVLGMSVPLGILLGLVTR